MRIITWNMQGANWGSEMKWATVANQLLSGVNGADILCLQECGPPVGCNPNKGKVEFLRWNKFDVVYYYSDAGSNRCNLALISHNYGVYNYRIIEPQVNTHRGVVGARYGDVCWVFSIHAKSGQGAQADALNLLNAVASAGLPGRWIVAGDFNCEPHQLQDPLRRWIVCGPNVGTHPVGQHRNARSMYDYAVVSANFGASVRVTVVDNSFTIPSDHYPVVIDF